MKKIKVILVVIAIIVLMMIFFQLPSRDQEKIGKKIKLQSHVKQQKSDGLTKQQRLNLEKRNRVPKQDFYDGLFATFHMIPHYRNASGILNTQTNRLFRNYFVTIVTQTTVDRLSKVSMMAEKWKAPLSISVFIKNPDKELKQLNQQLEQFPALLYYADIHVLIANKTRYPVNNLRNLAINNSRTDFVFIMDADFLPPLGLHDYIVRQKQFFNINHSNQQNFANNLLNFNHKRPNQTVKPSVVDYQPLIIDYNLRSTLENNNNNDNIEESTKESIDKDTPLKVAFVIPSFSSSEPPNTLPNDKVGMVGMIKSGKVVPSNIKVCKKCHSPTDFGRWMEEVEPYEVEYKWIFEPYLVYNKSQGIPFDERFKGYGFDKNSHGFCMAVEGFHFIVLPESFIIHVNHKSASWEGPSLDDQQWDALRVACSLIPAIKVKNNYDPTIKLFDEPLQDECFSDSHW